MVDRYLYPATSPTNTLVNVPVCLAMVGLPARGKTFIGRKLARFLNWTGIQTKGISTFACCICTKSKLSLV